MTENELKSDCNKFIEYLNANGVCVLAHCIVVEHTGQTKSFVAGNAETIDELAIRMLADSHGLKVKEAE